MYWELRECSIEEVASQGNTVKGEHFAYRSVRKQYSRRKEPCEKGPKSEKIKPVVNFSFQEDC